MDNMKFVTGVTPRGVMEIWLEVVKNDFHLICNIFFIFKNTWVGGGRNDPNIVCTYE
jgi:hypothetical protein